MAKADYLKIFRWSFPFEVLNKDLKLIYASNLAGSFGDGLFAYLLPNYMTKNLNASSVEIGILYAVVSLAAASTLFIAGKLADKYDRKKIMILGWISWIPVPLIFSLARNWVQMLPGMILWGFWLGGPTGTAYIVTSADKSRLTLTFTVISSAWSIGYIASPALGGYLAEIIGMQVVLYLAFILYTAAAIILTFIRSQQATGYAQKKPEEQHSLFKLLKTRKLLMFSAIFGSIMFFLMMFRPFTVKFLGEIYHYGDFEIGVLGSVSFFGSAILGILLGRLGDKWKKSYALSISMMLCTLTLVLMLLSNNFYVLLVVFFLVGGSYLTWSLMSAIIGPHAPESIRARWISIPQTIGMFSSFIAPYIGGIIYDLSSYYLFIVAIIATSLLAVLTSLAEC